MLKKTHLWLPQYIKDRLLKLLSSQNAPRVEHLLFTICDHFEPYWGKVSDNTAAKRLKTWLDRYSRCTEKHRDNFGNAARQCFFCPEEAYRKRLLNQITELCHNGYGETEVHLHHDNDTPENLRRTLADFKNKLAQ